MDDKTPPFSAVEAVRYGWTTTRSNLRPLLVLGAVGGFLSMFQQVTNRLESHGVVPLLGLGAQVLQAGVALAFLRVALSLHDGRPLDEEHPASLLEGFLPYLLVSMLYGLIVVGGLVLLIVPGVIWALQFAFAGVILADRGVDPVEALRRSRTLTRGVKRALLRLGGIGHPIVLGVKVQWHAPSNTSANGCSVASTPQLQW